MRIQLFSVEEANRLAGELKPALEALVGIKREFDAVQGRVDVLGLALAGAAASNPDARELRRLLERRAPLAQEIGRGVDEIQRRGCVIKDVDRGLVDFYSIVGDRLIFLCWHLGEAEVMHWHTLEGGFAGRQPLHTSERE